MRQPTRAELRDAIHRGDIDTVVMAFPDLQGRLVGKRTSGTFFLQQVEEHGTENCDYLIATDFDDVAVPGYKFASYDLGYGDMVARADFGTIRFTPWVPKTALIFCDVFSVKTGEPIAVAPRQILRDQVAAAQRMNLEPMIGSEIEFYLFRDSYDQLHDKGYRNLLPHSPFMEDYQIVQTTRDEYVVGEIRRGLEAAAIPVEFSKGEAGRGQHEINLSYTRALEMADRNTVYKTAAKEIAAGLGRSVTFMAKYDFAETGSSCHVHSSLWHLSEGAMRGSAFDAGHGDGARDSTPSHGTPAMTDHFRMYLAGQLAAARDFSILWAPTVNSYKRFQPGSWAPTAVAWGVDNRTLGYRVVGHGASTRVECRIPGADANSYLAFAGTIAAGLYGIRHRLQLDDAYSGNGYEAKDLPRIPTTLAEAADLWEHSAIARECFGDDVHHHLLTMARHEWSSFQQTVTDWERVRYFERA
ncbi:MAG: glutamine synthetase family protein [Ilumatobacteraceae bacterium]|jgi:glutamine synthetase